MNGLRTEYFKCEVRLLLEKVSKLNSRDCNVFCDIVKKILKPILLKHN